jgi:hypothetical protein
MRYEIIQEIKTAAAAISYAMCLYPRKSCLTGGLDKIKEPRLSL